jgi:hypothetical protein
MNPTKEQSQKLLQERRTEGDAMSLRNPILVVARDEYGTELIAAIVDGENKEAIENQADKLKEQFPNAATIHLEHLEEELQAKTRQYFPWRRLLFEHAHSEWTIRDVRRMGGGFGVVGWIIGVGIFDLLLPVRAVSVVIRWLYGRNSKNVYS